MLIAVLGLWQGYLLLQEKSIGRSLYVRSAIALGVVTVAISLLLTVAEFYDRLQHYSPHLMQQLGLLFGR